MVWECFTRNGPSPLVKLKEKITAVIYVNILENYLLPYIDTLENKESYIFQKNNASIYIARLIKNWKEENNIDSFP